MIWQKQKPHSHIVNVSFNNVFACEPKIFTKLITVESDEDNEGATKGNIVLPYREKIVARLWLDEQGCQCS